MMSSLLTRAYYALKPSIPWQARLALRRRLARRVRRRLPDRWYINEAAGRVPDGWPGWPDGKQFAFVVTHDVDGTRGLDRCLHLAETDRRHWIQAAFNFVPEKSALRKLFLRRSNPDRLALLKSSWSQH